MRASAPRRPGFLGPLAPFSREGAAAVPAPFARPPETPPAPAPFLRDARPDHASIRPLVQPAVAAPPPPAGPVADPFRPAPAPAPPERLPPEYLSRLAASIDTLRLHADRLTELCAEDALAVGTAIARRILEAELSRGHEALVPLIRSALRKVGDSRRVTVRLSPADAEAIRAAGTRFAGERPATAVEIADDEALGPGDVKVDADFGTVDGRLDTRLEEARRALADALGDGGDGR